MVCLKVGRISSRVPAQKCAVRRLHFQYLLHRGVGGGHYPFLRLLRFTLDTYLIMLRVKQGGTKYHFLSRWCDSTWDWTWSPGPLANTLPTRPVSRFDSSGNSLIREFLFWYQETQFFRVRGFRFLSAASWKPAIFKN